MSTAESISTEEDRRLEEDGRGDVDWRRWGTYLAERQWGTVREDYSADGDPWKYFPYDMARSRAYRWGEDGLLGWTDTECRLCFSTTLWNGRDPHLKERFFGLSNSQGNHGEDAKELYYYLDATPTASYCKALYKYPQTAFPYQDLIDENHRRGFGDLEHEIIDTGVFGENRYFDCEIEYAKESADATLIRLTISNRGPDRADLTALPTLTFRNTWAWGDRPLESARKPELYARRAGVPVILADHETLGRYALEMLPDPAARELEWATLFTDNATNPRVFDKNAPAEGYYKDAFNQYLVDRVKKAVNPALTGTKAAILIKLSIEAGATRTIRLRLGPQSHGSSTTASMESFDACMERRIAEADAFYADRLNVSLDRDERNISRQAYASLLWSKQVYIYNVQEWLDGDIGQPPAPAERLEGRNAKWRHLSCHDVISMPDKWEYPWFASWDLAFHTIPFARLDPAFAKQQLLLLLQERYLNPNGALPAYEFGFGDANPPVHAMAVLKVYEIDKAAAGVGDIVFLERAFIKLLLNFTWWVNRNDEDGKNLFGGGFLGLDNIGVFDRNLELPEGKTLQQADATAWMGLYCSTMIAIAFELHGNRPAVGEIGVKFLHHYFLIIEALNTLNGSGLWDEEDGFFYDQVTAKGENPITMKVMSVVGLIPLSGIYLLRKDQLEHSSALVRQAVKRGLDAHPHLKAFVQKAEVEDGPYAGTEFLAIVPKARLKRMLEHLLDEEKFLSPYGIRSVSKVHAAKPFELHIADKVLRVDYVPGEGNSNAFGGNSNWRGPIWFPVNLLIMSSLEHYHLVYGDALKVECPVGSGRMLNLQQVASEIARRLSKLFRKDDIGARPCHGGVSRYADDRHWQHLVLFNEYFHAETGRGLGASHQTGWTALVAMCIERAHES